MELLNLYHEISSVLHVTPETTYTDQGRLSLSNLTESQDLMHTSYTQQPKMYAGSLFASLLCQMSA